MVTIRILCYQYQHSLLIAENQKMKKVILLNCIENLIYVL